MLGVEFEKRVDAIVANYPQPKAALLPVLWEVQKARGSIDLDAEEWVATRLGIAASHVHGCVTFYTMYKQKPSGRHHIQVCTTLSCMLRGSDELVKHLESKLGIKAGETTADGKFSIVRVECLGRAAPPDVPVERRLSRESDARRGRPSSDEPRVSDMIERILTRNVDNPDA
jgi:NADH:ubiquinone oxidoreductase subunit E